MVAKVNEPSSKQRQNKNRHEQPSEAEGRHSAGQTATTSCALQRRCAVLHRPQCRRETLGTGWLLLLTMRLSPVHACAAVLCRHWRLLAADCCYVSANLLVLPVQNELLDTVYWVSHTCP